MDWTKLISEILDSGFTQAGLGAELGKSQAWVGAVLAGKYEDVKWSDGEKIRALHAAHCGTQPQPEAA